MWHYGFFPFAPILFVLLFGLLITRLLFRRGPWGYRGRECGRSDDAETVLRVRLAKGEISEDEYKRLKEILAK